MEGARSEVLLSQGGSIYMRQIRFDRELNIQESPRITRLGDRRTGLHLFSTSSLLDDSWYNRTFWMYSTRWPGYYRANKASKCGQILVFDDSTTYGVKVYDQESTKRPWFEPGAGYQLFADSNDNEPQLEERAANWDKGPGFSRSRPPIWTKKIPIRARALLLAGETLFVAGPPDAIEATDPLAAFEGRMGGKLWALAARDGQELVRYELESPPVLDGLIAARERLYLCTTAGRILCYAGK
jgi:outer membrane protein assembly factor BamB